MVEYKSNDKTALGILLMMFIFMIYLIAATSTSTVQTVPFVEMDPTPQQTRVIPVMLDFADTSQSAEMEPEFTATFSQAAEFVSNSSAGKMSLVLGSVIYLQASYSEAYYGNNTRTDADINLWTLIEEVVSVWEVDSVVILYHPGVAEELIEGNITGIIDQYLEIADHDRTQPDAKFITMSRYSPWSVLVHELGHYWGLPDMYYAHMVGVYGMMGAGVWLVPPADFSPWSKDKLGWLSYWNMTSDVTKLELEDFNGTVKFEDFYISRLTVPSGVHIFTDSIKITIWKAQVTEDDSQTIKLSNGLRYVISLDGATLKIRKILSINVDALDFDYLAYRFGQAMIVIIMVFLLVLISQVVARYRYG